MAEKLWHTPTGAYLSMDYDKRHLANGDPAGRDIGAPGCYPGDVRR
jgi:hypothetical protein